MAKQNGVTNEEIVEAMQVARYMKRATVNNTIANSLKLLAPTTRVKKGEE